LFLLHSFFPESLKTQAAPEDVKGGGLYPNSHRRVALQMLVPIEPGRTQESPQSQVRVQAT